MEDIYEGWCFGKDNGFIIIHEPKLCSNHATTITDDGASVEDHGFFFFQLVLYGVGSGRIKF